jgi:transcription antitermination factor NusG
VRIVSGPLAGLEAAFDRPLGPRERVQVLVRFLGQVNRAEVSCEALEPLVERERPPRRTRGRGRPIGRP